jgi:hypothetical protein
VRELYESLVPITTQVNDTTSVNKYFRALAPTQGSTGFTDWWQEIWYAKAPMGAAGATVTVTFSAQAGFGIVSAHQYSGSANTDPTDLQEAFDAATGQVNQGGAPTSGTIITSAARLIFGAAIFDQNASGPGAGFNVRSTLDGCIAEDKAAQEQFPAVPISVAATFDISAKPNQRWIAQVVTFK